MQFSYRFYTVFVNDNALYRSPLHIISLVMHFKPEPVYKPQTTVIAKFRIIIVGRDVIF